MTFDKMYTAEQKARALIAGNDTILAKVNALPQEKQNSYKVELIAKILVKGKHWQHNDSKFLGYFEKSAQCADLSVGDEILLIANPVFVQSPKNPKEFNYKRYLSFHAILTQVYLPNDKWKLLKKTNSLHLRGAIAQLRNQMQEQFERFGTSDDNLAIVSALILGDKSNLTNSLQDAYASAGAMHVLAVSGLHVGFIYLLLLRLFGQSKSRKPLKWWGAVGVLAGIWAYAVLTGLSPSVLRASTMFSFIVTAKSLNRQGNIFNTLAASALFLLILDPLMLLEVGFQLSYSAVLGIVIIQPWLANLFFSRYWIIQKCWEISTVSIAAQMGTFPLGLLYFHQFPNYFLVSNLFVIPLATTILFGGITFLALSWIPFINTFLAYCLNKVIAFLNYLVYTVEAWPYSIAKGIKFTVLDTWVIYLFIAGMVLYVVRLKKIYLWCSILLLILFFTATSSDIIHHKSQVKLLIPHTKQSTIIELIEGKNSYVYCKDSLILNHHNYRFATDNYHIYNRIQSISFVSKKLHHPTSKIWVNGNFILFGDCRIGILDEGIKFIPHEQKLQVDYLIVTKACKLRLAQINTMFSYSLLVIDGSVSHYRRQNLRLEAKKNNTLVHDMQTQGALDLTL